MDNHERAVKAVNERWHPTIPRATHSGILNIAGQEIVCDVLIDGRRVLRQKTFMKIMGRGKAGGKEVKREGDTKLPVFLQANNLTAYLKKEITEAGAPIHYKSIDGRKLIGYEASILPEVCKIYVLADDDKVLQENQRKIAAVCRGVLYSLAKVGVIALIDEATGYQEIRQRNELQQILEKYISQELREWTKKFPDEFFKQVYRIHGWEYPKLGHPQYLGKFINKYVYERLPQGVLEELENKNPFNENGNRKYRHHQFLSEGIGDDNLKKQLVQTITVMKLSNNIDEFKELIEKL